MLATNTSGMSVTEIAQAVYRPERFAGMHWVNPPHLIPLVEVIAGEASADETLDILCDIAVSLEKKPVRVYKDPTGAALCLHWSLRNHRLRRHRHLQQGGQLHV